MGQANTLHGPVLEVLASGARTTTTNSSTYYTPGAVGVVVSISISAITATPSVTFTIQGYDEISDRYYTVLASAAQTATNTGGSLLTLTVYPGITASANVAASAVLPPQWRVNCAHGDADSMTYSVGAQLLK